MLTRLVLSELALVDSLELEFGSGLCLLTGETGAGKSILVGALGLLAGRRADSEMLRAGAEEAVVEGTFCPVGAPAESLVRSWGIPCEGEAVVRRRIGRGGRSSATVNGASVTVAQLRALGETLLEIHGQHEGQRLLEEEGHRALLDGLAGVCAAAGELAETHRALQAAVADLRELRRGAAERAQRLDSVRFQRDEIDRVGPKPGEEEELRTARSRLLNAGAIAENAAALQALLRDGEASVSHLLGEARRRAAELARFDPEWQAYGRDLDQAAGALGSVGEEAERLAATVSYDPESLERTEERLAGLERLKRKYGPELGDVLALRDSLEEEYRRLTAGPSDEGEAKARVEAFYGEYLTQAGRLTAARERAARDLGEAVERELRPLALDKARFAVSLRPVPCAGPAEARAVGLEDVSFSFSANPGEPLKALAKIASGGELSRTMLALLSAARVAGGPETVVFDEVDTGIGGRPAEAVGRRLRSLAAGRQVLCITHLPQIAAWADHHTRVVKVVEAGRTRVRARALGGAERVEELARMLAGETVTDTARRHASALLKGAVPGA